MEKKKSPQELLQEGNIIQLSPSGYSMYPFLNPDKGDQVVIKPAGDTSPKVGDVVLFRRDGKKGIPNDLGLEGGLLILHRIQKVERDGYYLVGDNQSKPEGPVKREQIIGIMTARVRNGRRLEQKSIPCRVWGRLWLAVCPFRDGIKKPLARVKQMMKKQKIT